MTTLVTGGVGFIASHLTESLLSSGKDVIIIGGGTVLPAASPPVSPARRGHLRFVGQNSARCMHTQHLALTVPFREAGTVTLVRGQAAGTVWGTGQAVGTVWGDLVHYSGGFASVASFAAATEMPHTSLLWLGARVLLDSAGGLFGLYFLVMFGLYLASCVMRLRHRVPARRSGPGV